MNEVFVFQDFIKESLLDNNFVTSLNSSDIIVSLIVSLFLSLFIFFIYKNTFRGVLYTQAFNISLVMVSLVTTLIIMTISSNLILSLGMVGALSIVRFRTAVKDSMDIVYMFWAISVGIANGAGYFHISFIGSIFIAIVLLILTKYKEVKNPYLLIINYNEDASSEIKKCIQNLGFYKLKSKTITSDNTELTLEIRTDNDHEIINKIQQISGVKDCVLVSYNGDYVS